jgi:hypothetical protein
MSYTTASIRNATLSSRSEVDALGHPAVSSMIYNSAAVSSFGVPVDVDNLDELVRSLYARPAKLVSPRAHVPAILVPDARPSAPPSVRSDRSVSSEDGAFNRLPSPREEKRAREVQGTAKARSKAGKLVNGLVSLCGSRRQWAKRGDFDTLATLDLGDEL